MLKVIDNFLPEDDAREFSRKLFEDKTWSAGWNVGLNKNEQQSWNWHRAIGNDVVAVGSDSQQQLPEFAQLLWEQTEKTLFELSSVDHLMERCYSNSHTFGMEGPIHTDDGSLTCIYYPCEDWNIHWEGGTVFFNEELTDAIKYTSYKFNRMVIFDANIPHRAMPVTRDCYRLRTSFVFKTSMDTNSMSYVDWYNNR